MVTMKFSTKNNTKLQIVGSNAREADDVLKNVRDILRPLRTCELYFIFMTYINT